MNKPKTKPIPATIRKAKIRELAEQAKNPVILHGCETVQFLLDEIKRQQGTISELRCNNYRLTRWRPI